MKIRLVKLLLGLGTAAMLLSGCYKKEIADLHNTHDADMAKLRDGLTSVQSSVQTTVNNLEAAKTTLEAEISNLQQQIKDASGKSEEFAGEIKTLKEKLTGCENELVEVKKTLEKIAGLNIDEKLQELNVLIETAGKMEGRVATLEENQALILKSYATLAKVEEIVNGAFAEFVANDFYTNLEKYKATILAWFTQDLSEQMKAALDTAFNNYYTIAQVDEQLDNMRDEIYDEMDEVCGDMGKDIEDLKDSIEVHRTEIDALKRSVSALEGDVVDIIREAIENGEFEAAFGKLLSGIISDVSQLKKDVEDLQTSVNGILALIGDDEFATEAKTIIAAINELKGRIDDVVDPEGKLASDIAAVKAEADSLANVTKALESKNGSASGRIDSLASVTASIEANYNELFNRVDSLKNAVDARLASIEALKGVSLVYVPDYDDGKASLYIEDPKAETLSGSLTMNFRVYSEKEIDGDWVEESVKGHFIGTQTRAAAGSEVTPESASYEDGVLTVEFSYDQFSDIYESYRAVAVSAVVGGIAASTYVPIYVQPYLAVEPGEQTFYFTYEGGTKEVINVSAAPGIEWSVEVDGNIGILVNGKEELSDLTGSRVIEITTEEISSRASGSIIISGAGIEYVYNVVREQEYNFQLTQYSSNRNVSVNGSNITVRSWDDESAYFNLIDANTGSRITSGVKVSVTSGNSWLSARWSNGRVYVSVDEFNFRRGQYNWSRTGSFTVEYDGQVQEFSVTQYNSWWWWDD